VEGLEQSKRVAGELRSIRKVRVIPERTFAAQTIVDWTHYGPCLRCGKDTEYGFSRSGTKSEIEDWLLKQNEKSRRKGHISYLEGRRQDSLGHISLRNLEGIICESCRTACAEARSAVAKRKEEKKEAELHAKKRQLEQDRREREQWVYHTTWRDSEPGEFENLRDGVARFTAEIPSKRRWKILFRWRPVDGLCRGDSPRNVVGMWVDRKFVARYHGWKIEPLKGQRPYFDEDLQWSDNGGSYDWPPPEDSARQDVFGVGFCRWLEGQFQAELLRLKPVATWTARTRYDCWPLDVPSIRKINTPCVIHTHWIDGTAYAQILYDEASPKVIHFAEEHLGMRINQTTDG